MAEGMNKNRKTSYNNLPFASMEVQSVLLDGESEIAVILLANAINEEEIFPIVTGLYGGERIAGIIKKSQCLRPLTHDLLINIIHTLRGKVEKIVMDKDINEDVVSTIHIGRYAKKVLFEARACDALAIALTSHAPIYVRKSQLLTLSEILERIQHINDQKFLAWLNAFEG
jgi:bifunctional DNase/RNase